MARPLDFNHPATIVYVAEVRDALDAARHDESLPMALRANLTRAVGLLSSLPGQRAKGDGAAMSALGNGCRGPCVDCGRAGTAEGLEGPYTVCKYVTLEADADELSDAQRKSLARFLFGESDVCDAWRDSPQP